MGNEQDHYHGIAVFKDPTDREKLWRVFLDGEEVGGFHEFSSAMAEAGLTALQFPNTLIAVVGRYGEWPST